MAFSRKKRVLRFGRTLSSGDGSVADMLHASQGGLPRSGAPRTAAECPGSELAWPRPAPQGARRWLAAVHVRPGRTSVALAGKSRRCQLAIRSSLMLRLAVAPGQVAASRLRRRERRVSCAAGNALVEPKTKIAFAPELQGQRCLGVGVRSKQLLGPIAVSVYALALYCDEAEAKRMLAAQRTQDAAAALLAGDVPLTLSLVFARSVTSAQFTDAITSELATRSTDAATLEAFCAYFRTRTLDAGAMVVLSSKPAAGLDVTVLAQQSTTLPAPGATFASPAFARALLDVYLGERSIVPDAKAAWNAGARAL